MSEMSVHEVLVAARNVQERRGFDWSNGEVGRAGPCCPGAAIAEAAGGESFTDTVDHPAAVVLADEFPPLNTDPPAWASELSWRVMVQANEQLTAAQLLEAFDRAIAKTARAPDLENVLGDEWAMA